MRGNMAVFNDYTLSSKELIMATTVLSGAIYYNYAEEINNFGKDVYNQASKFWEDVPASIKIMASITLTYTLYAQFITDRYPLYNSIPVSAEASTTDSALAMATTAAVLGASASQTSALIKLQKYVESHLPPEIKDKLLPMLSRFFQPEETSDASDITATLITAILQKRDHEDNIPSEEISLEIREIAALITQANDDHLIELIGDMLPPLREAEPTHTAGDLFRFATPHRAGVGSLPGSAYSEAKAESEQIERGVRPGPLYDRLAALDEQLDEQLPTNNLPLPRDVNNIFNDLDNLILLHDRGAPFDPAIGILIDEYNLHLGHIAIEGLHGIDAAIELATALTRDTTLNEWAQDDCMEIVNHLYEGRPPLMEDDIVSIDSKLSSDSYLT